MEQTKDKLTQIEGRNAVIELLKSDRDIDKVLVQSGVQNDGTIKKIISMGKDISAQIIMTPKSKLDEISVSKSHQGVIAFSPLINYVSVDDIIDIANIKKEPPFLLILDGITDTHNFGAIIRSAEGCGVHGIIIPKRRSVSLNATVGKTSAGAYLNMPIAKVSNIAQTVEELKKTNIWVYCLDERGKNIYETDLKGSIAIVVGAEGEGVSRLVKEKCDFAVKIPMRGQITSLNASVATGITIYEILRQRTTY